MPAHHQEYNDQSSAPVRVLISAGPTHEPIDRVRYIANRSSGRVGLALAREAMKRGCSTTLLMGPIASSEPIKGVTTHHYGSTADLEKLLNEHLPACDVLIMAAAVADYRPVLQPGAMHSKIRRDPENLTLTLEPTPDLLAGCAAKARPDQCLVGFALEPENDLLEHATAKLKRKGIDLIVANPLKTMDSQTISAWLIGKDGVIDQTQGDISKEQFATWLMENLLSR